MLCSKNSDRKEKKKRDELLNCKTLYCAIIIRQRYDRNGMHTATIDLQMTEINKNQRKSFT